MGKHRSADLLYRRSPLWVRFYSCNKIRQSPISIIFLPIAVFLRSLAWLAYLVAFVLQSAHRAFLWLTRGYLRQKRRRLEWSLAALISSLNCDYHLATAPINSFVFVGVLDFYHPEFIVQVDFTDPPKLEGGVCHKPLCCRRCRRTCDEAEVVYHPDSFTCLIFDRRKSGCRGNADSLYFFFSVGNLLLSLIFLWLRISEATHKEFLRYSKSEAR